MRFAHPFRPRILTGRELTSTVTPSGLHTGEMTASTAIFLLLVLFLFLIFLERNLPAFVLF